MKADEVKQFLGSDTWENAFKFAFVRNPWEQMVSCYHWWKEKAHQFPHIADHYDRARKLKNFREFLHSELGLPMLNEFQGNPLDWIEINGSVAIDFVGKFERSNEDWAYICKKLGIPPPQLPHMNITRHQPYQCYYDDEMRDIVEARFQREIKVFNYQF